jgi:uncharacterized protein (TIGR02453 family)
MMFAGFPLGAQQFLAELAENNDRAWFAENRERYESDLLDPEKDFVDAVGGKFAQLDQRVQAVPAVNRSIFRINRDVRFTPDKSPYKTHSDLWFWVGDDRKFASGYFVRILPDAVWIGGGQYQMGPSRYSATSRPPATRWGSRHSSGCRRGSRRSKVARTCCGSPRSM